MNKELFNIRKSVQAAYRIVQCVFTKSLVSDKTRMISVVKQKCASIFPWCCFHNVL
jgi:hypothetical protein